MGGFFSHGIGRGLADYGTLGLNELRVQGMKNKGFRTGASMYGGLMSGMETFGLGNRFLPGAKGNQAWGMGTKIGQGIDLAALLAGGAYLGAGAMGAGGMGGAGMTAGGSEMGSMGAMGGMGGGMTTAEGMSVNAPGMTGGFGGGGGGMGMPSMGNMLGMGAIGLGMFGQQGAQRQQKNQFKKAMQMYQGNNSMAEAAYNQHMKTITGQLKAHYASQGLDVNSPIVADHIQNVQAEMASQFQQQQNQQGRELAQFYGQNVPSTNPMYGQLAGAGMQYLMRNNFSPYGGG